MTTHTHMLSHVHTHTQGRDASARLTRSLKAQKLREGIPDATEALKQQLEEWTAVEGAPFMFDGHNYMVCACMRVRVFVCIALKVFEVLQRRHPWTF